jgi:chromosome segregation ATPase
MLMALGMLLASLIALILAPAYRARTARLTAEQIRRSLPMTEEEIAADKDRIRAARALDVHKLSSEVEEARLAAARQKVELNRRDAAVRALQGEIEQLKLELEEHANARRVLEQSVTTRLPVLEERLAEARKLLHQRDNELALINAETGKTLRALDEALQVNAQQRNEIDRLISLLPARKRGREPAPGGELEASRMLARIKTELTKSPQGEVSESPEDRARRLERVLADAEAALRSAHDKAAAEQAERAAIEARLRVHAAMIDEQGETIRRLEASLAAYERGPDGRTISFKDSKIAMKARIAAMRAEIESQAATIERLRAELAAANERNAAQAGRLMEEMRYLSSRAAVGGRRASPAQRGLAEGIGEAPRGTAPQSAEIEDATADDGRNAAPGPDQTASDRPRQPSDGGDRAGVQRPRLLERIAGIAKS